MRQRLPLIGLIAAVVLGAGSPSPVAAAPPTLTATVVQSGLVVPWDVAFLPDGRMVVTERPGRIRVYASGAANAALEATVTVPSVRAEGEAGLMGIAVDRDFVNNPYVYVCASRTVTGGAWHNEVLRYRLSGGTWSAPTVILGGMLANTIHDGCALEMDRSYALWVSMGDAANGSNAQSTSSRNGKILRITRSGQPAPGNPTLSGQSGPTAVYSLGHRNVQGIAPRPETGQVFGIEHGPERDDEINLLAAGGNFGWPCYTGAGLPYQPGGCRPATSYANPSWASGAPTIATSGGAFVDNAAWGDWNGQLFVATLKESDLRRFSVSPGGTGVGQQEILYNGAWGRLRAAVRGPAGQLYLTTSNGSNDRVIRLSPTNPTVVRRAGADRYATAAAVSSYVFAAGVRTVFVATGENWPDGAAASAAAGALHTPVLLARRDSIPSATAAELNRLAPQSINVVGGPSSISDATLTALDAYTTGSVRRLAGADRYETASAVSRAIFAAPVPTAFVVTGENWPDALSAGAAAATAHSPVLLVRGTSIPPSTAAELDRLNPGRILVVGSSAVVSEAVAVQLAAYTTGGVTRLAGGDRYATAAAVATQRWDGFDVAWVVSGENWPDALVAGAAAGAQHAPVLLTAANSLPTATGQSLVLGHPPRHVVVGSSAVVGHGPAGALATLQGAP
jgi:glucose/arabinose dehydrogenase/putative cell wall-binding protein